MDCNFLNQVGAVIVNSACYSIITNKMPRKLLSQFTSGNAVMPWLNTSVSVRSSSQALHCDYEICRAAKQDTLNFFSRANQFRTKAVHVAFSDRIDVNEIPPVGNFSSSTNSIWWSREDYSRMLFNAKLALSKMAENRLPISDRSSDVCTIGLEGFSGSEYKKSKERKIRVTSAVLMAQENHKLEGIKDPVYIAELSRSFTSTSAQEAYRRANHGTVIEIPRIEESIAEEDFVEIII